MKAKTKKILLILIVIVFAMSAVMMMRQIVQYREGQRSYDEAESLMDIPEVTEEESIEETEEEGIRIYMDPYTNALKDTDLDALREVNEDVLGYILIPDTEISYPILQAEDNQYYLTRTWEKTESVMGSIFLECQNSPDFSDFNTIIYGHRMKNGSMFAGLKYYKELSYWQEHPKVYILNDEGCRCYEIFAAYEVSTSGTTYRLGGFTKEESRQEFIDFGLDNSVIDTGITPKADGQILTLSTCTGNGHATRWVVQAMLLGIDPIESA